VALDDTTYTCHLSITDTCKLYTLRTHWCHGEEEPLGVFHGRRAAVAVICLALAGACSSTNRPTDTVAGTQSGSSSSSSDPSASATARGTSAGVRNADGTTPAASGGNASTRTPGEVGPDATGALSKVTSPIEIGFVRTGVSNAGDFGVDFGETVSEAKVIDALVKAYNDAGGIAGRKIVPVYADTDTATNRWDADFAAACATFTQDHKVVAVLGYVFDFQPPLEDCLAKKAIPHLSTSFNVPDAEIMRRYPLLMALSTPRIERRSIAKIDGAIRDKVLTPKKRLGVLMDKCPGTERSWDQKVLLYLKRRGVTPVSVEKLSCAGGSSDNGRAIQEVQNAILRMRAARVDTIMPHSVSEGPGVLVFSVEASSQNWSPTYIVSSLVNAAVLGSQMPAGQAAMMHGYGWLPVQDTPPAKWLPSVTPSGKRCIAMVRKEGLTPSSAADYSYVLNVCEALFVYERALRATNGHHDGSLIKPAIEAAGRFDSAINLEGGSVLSRTVHDAPSRVRHFAWDGECRCFVYTGGSRPMPEVA
jgi:hypothetical protein